MFDYTTDYVGQLGRAGKINSVIVGRNRYIDQSSLENYVASMPLLPENKEGEINATTNSTRDASKWKVYEPKSTQVSIGGSEINRDGIMTVDYGRTQSVAALFLIPLICLSIIVGVVGASKRGTSMFYVSEPMKSVLGASVGSQSAGILSSIPYFFGLVNDAYVDYLRVASAFIKKSIANITGSRIEGVNMSKNNETKNSLGIDSSGLVVRKGAGDMRNDKQIVEDIKKSFSDEVSVTIDKSGSSGVIRPVFKTIADDYYNFVLVPVKQKK